MSISPIENGNFGRIVYMATKYHEENTRKMVDLTLGPTVTHSDKFSKINSSQKGARKKKERNKKTKENDEKLIEEKNDICTKNLDPFPKNMLTLSNHPDMQYLKNVDFEKNIAAIPTETLREKLTLGYEFKSFAQAEFTIQEYNNRTFHVFRNTNNSELEEATGNFISLELKCIVKECLAHVCLNYRRNEKYEEIYKITNIDLEHNHVDTKETFEAYFANQLTELENIKTVQLISKMGEENLAQIAMEISKLTGKKVSQETVEHIAIAEKRRRKRAVYHLINFLKSKDLMAAKKMKIDNETKS